MSRTCTWASGWALPRRMSIPRSSCLRAQLQRPRRRRRRPRRPRLRPRLRRRHPRRARRHHRRRRRLLRQPQLLPPLRLQSLQRLPRQPPHLQRPSPLRPPRRCRSRLLLPRRHRRRQARRRRHRHRPWIRSPPPSRCRRPREVRSDFSDGSAVTRHRVPWARAHPAGARGSRRDASHGCLAMRQCARGRRSPRPGLLAPDEAGISRPPRSTA
jgi:hypothetical protein